MKATADTMDATTHLTAFNYNERTYCGELRSNHVGQEVTLFGWADTVRDHGGLIFIEMRDVSGVVQAVFDHSLSAPCFDAAESVKSEYVIAVAGTVRQRSEDSVNRSLDTGEVEVVAHRMSLLNTANPTPFTISGSEEPGEEVRLRYRYLDLRRQSMKDTIIKRHRAMQTARRYLEQKRFFEIETPILNKSTPEGARDFLVPSRLNRGLFYALPQSPQLFKQILMVAGFDRYFQVVKCFRDEDLRNDRQPEFTQIDMELSFVDAGMIMAVTEGLVKAIIEAIADVTVSTPFPRIPYDEAIARYGSDKPDLRFGLPITDCTDIFVDSGFNVFSANLKKGGVIRGLCVADDTRLTRMVTDGYSEYVKQFGAGGFPMCRVIDGNFQGGIAKFISDDEKIKLIDRFSITGPSVLFFSSDREEVVMNTLANMRQKIARDLAMIDNRLLNFAWITDFPLLEYSTKDRRYYAMHHPFTAPAADQEHLLDDISPDSAERIKAQAYDLVLNGVEIGGGSIRINRQDLQSRIFTILGISPEEASERFSFLLRALQFGAPPHGGIALGLDRILMILLEKNSIREVIPFPKTQKGQCLMSGSPTEVTNEQLKELAVRTVV